LNDYGMLSKSTRSEKNDHRADETCQGAKIG